MKMKQIKRFLQKHLAFYHVIQAFNPYLDLFTGGKNRPVFFDIDQTEPALRALDRAYPEIRAEFQAVMARQDLLPRYHELDTNNIKVSGRYQRDKRWNVYMLYCYGAKPESYRALCPRTCAELEKIPRLCQAFFSILDPGKSIPAHAGNTRAYLRYHLGLSVPAHNPPQIRVKDSFYTWKEGESVLFDDSWDHEIINEADQPRAVLIVDILRPMPFAGHIVVRSLQRLCELSYGPSVLKNLEKFRLD